jgi:hypothetical protein
LDLHRLLGLLDADYRGAPSPFAVAEAVMEFFSVGCFDFTGWKLDCCSRNPPSSGNRRQLGAVHSTPYVSSRTLWTNIDSTPVRRSRRF